jgi:ribosome maturation factor RimP
MPAAGRRNFAGVLKSVRNGSVVLDIDGEEHALAFDAIDKANLVPEL